MDYSEYLKIISDMSQAIGASIIILTVILVFAFMAVVFHIGFKEETDKQVKLDKHIKDIAEKVYRDKE